MAGPDDYQVCPRCMGNKTIDCRCCGDFCCCDNGGEIDCPTCHGDGEVTAARAAGYFALQQEYRDAIRAVWSTPAPPQKPQDKP